MPAWTNKVEIGIVATTPTPPGGGGGTPGTQPSPQPPSEITGEEYGLGDALALVLAMLSIGFIGLRRQSKLGRRGA